MTPSIAGVPQPGTVTGLNLQVTPGKQPPQALAVPTNVGAPQPGAVLVGKECVVVELEVADGNKCVVVQSVREEFTLPVKPPHGKMLIRPPPGRYDP